MRVARRHILAMMAVLAAPVLATPGLASDGHLTATDAHSAARSGAVLLVDIRRPEEWQATGLPEGALPLDMRRPDFVAELDRALGGDRSRPVALICASGIRSARVAEVLRGMGYSDMRDVSEGMMGSAAGPGWVRRGLPVTAPR